MIAQSKPHRLGQRGETLVEVLVALAALGLVLGASAVILSRSSTSMQSTRERTAALGIAQSQIERTKQYIELNPAELMTATSTLRSSTGFCMRDTGGLAIRATDHSDCKRGIYTIRNTITRPASLNPAFLLTSAVEFEAIGNHNTDPTAAGGNKNVVQLRYKVYPQ